MESFEHVCKVALEAEGFVVTTNVKFFVTRKTSRADRHEEQTHGYEVDLLGARHDRLVLGEVKSYFGSYGVSRQDFRGLADESKTTHFSRYKLLNDDDLRAEVVRLACERYGYPSDYVEFRLFAGHFRNGHEEAVTAHLAQRGVRVVSLPAIADAVIGAASRKTYTDDPVIMTVKALSAAGRVTLE